MHLDDAWDRLRRVRTLTFTARSESRTGRNGCGEGTVRVEPAGEGVVTFTESGLWRPEGGRELRFSNVFRWSMSGGGLRPEHLRFGRDRPVHLFDLAPDENGGWRSVSPHLCSEDCHTAALLFREDRLVLQWSINGPKKQEEIEYSYSWTSRRKGEPTPTQPPA